MNKVAIIIALIITLLALACFPSLNAQPSTQKIITLNTDGTVIPNQQIGCMITNSTKTIYGHF